MERYKKLASYVLATVICDLNVDFVRRFINPRSRTKDQMEQAGRSGKQNIAEGYTMQSLEAYIKLIGVSEGSFKELTVDYEDFLRQNGFSIWPKDDVRIRAEAPKRTRKSSQLAFNFCQLETYLLGRQIATLKEKFVKEGGFRENLFKKRRDFLKRK